MRTPKETKIPGFPKLPPDASPALRRYLESVVEAVEVRLGRRGDPRDRAVTARELIDSGLAVEGKPFVLGQNQATLLPAGEDLETSLPTAPTGFEATGAYSVVILDWDQAYLQYAPHAFTEVWRHDTDQLADAILVGVEHGSVFTDQVGSDASYYYWVRHVNTRDQRGPWNSNSGTFAETAVDVEFMLELLNGEITESQLYNTLASRINLIDGNGAGSVNVRIGQEIAAEVISRNAAILVEVNARTAAIQAEAAARTAAINTQAAASAADILAEAVDRANGDTALDTQLTTLTSVTLPGNYASIAALQQEASTRSTADSAEATSRETLATQMRGNYSGTDVAQLSAGLVFSEKTSRVTADSALSSRSDVLEATVNNPTTGLVATRATLTNDYYTQTDTDSAIASAVTSLVSTTDLSTALNAYVTNATLTTNYYTQTDTDSAIASAITSLVSTTDLSTALNAYVTNATLTTNYYTQTDTDTAIASAITSLVSTTDLSTALNAYVTNATLTTNYYTQTDTDTAIASAVTSLVSTTDLSTALGPYATNATLTTNHYTKTDADTAIASAVTSLVSTTDLSTALGPYATNATLTTNHYTKTDADTAIASAVTNLVSTTDLSTALGPYATNATLTTNHYTKTDADSAIASAVTNLVSTTTLGNYTTTADLTTNYYTKTAADSAIASATTNLVSTSDLAGYATSSSVQQNFFAKADGESLEGQYTVKIDNNGNVAGFGLANTTTAAGSSSQFLVAADRFAIVGPNGTGLVPFTVQTTTTTVGGNTILPGVYITDAYIKNASITNLKIGDLAVDSAKIALLAVDTAQINNLAVDTAKIKDLAVETAKIKDLSVETAKINNQAVTVPSGVNQDTFLTLSTSWQTVCSLTVNMGTGVQAVLVSAFHNYQNTAQTSTQYDIAMKIEANGSGGGSVAHTHGNQTAVISSMAKYGGLTGNVLFTIKVKKNANAGTYRARNSGLLVQGIKK
jgi:hypothetical protein